MDIRQRLEKVLSSKAFVVGSVEIEALCRDALAEIERVDSISLGMDPRMAIASEQLAALIVAHRLLTPTPTQAQRAIAWADVLLTELALNPRS